MKRFSLLLVVALSLVVAMTVQSATRPTGALKVPTGLGLELKIDNKPVSVPTGKEVSLPAGTYVPATLTAGAQANGKGEVWTIKSTGPFGSIAKIEVKEGCTSTIDAGPPLTLKPIVYKATKGKTGTVMPIGVVIVGKAGEVYAANSIRKGQTSVPAPQVKISDEKGTVLASGNFEYG